VRIISKHLSMLPCMVLRDFQPAPTAKFTLGDAIFVVSIKATSENCTEPYEVHRNKSLITILSAPLGTVKVWLKRIWELVFDFASKNLQSRGCEFSPEKK